MTTTIPMWFGPGHRQAIRKATAENVTTEVLSALLRRDLSYLEDLDPLTWLPVRIDAAAYFAVIDRSQTFQLFAAEEFPSWAAAPDSGPRNAVRFLVRGGYALARRALGDPGRWSGDPNIDKKLLPLFDIGRREAYLKSLDSGFTHYTSEWMTRFGVTLGCRPDDERITRILEVAFDAGLMLGADEHMVAGQRRSESRVLAQRQQRWRRRCQLGPTPSRPAPPPLTGPIRPPGNGRNGHHEPTAGQRAALTEGWALVAAFSTDPEAWSILRRAALDAGDDDVAAMAKARLRELRR